MNEALSIRECGGEEAQSLLDLWRRAEATVTYTDTIEDIQRVIGDRAAIVLVAEADDRLVGSVIGTFDGWRGNLYRLAVHTGYRRQGIARKLVSEVEKRLVKRGVKRITALVEKDHPRATGFWDARGYEVDPNMVRYFRNIAPSDQVNQ